MLTFAFLFAGAILVLIILFGFMKSNRKNQAPMGRKSGAIPAQQPRSEDDRAA